VFFPCEIILEGWCMNTRYGTGMRDGEGCVVDCVRVGSALCLYTRCKALMVFNKNLIANGKCVCFLSIYNCRTTSVFDIAWVQMEIQICYDAVARLQLHLVQFVAPFVTVLGVPLAILNFGFMSKQCC